jgi:hypothetical protein
MCEVYNTLMRVRVKQKYLRDMKYMRFNAS